MRVPGREIGAILYLSRVLAQSEIGGEKWISQHLSTQSFEMSQTHTDGLDIRYFPRRDFWFPIAHLLGKGRENKEHPVLPGEPIHDTRALAHVRLRAKPLPDS